MNFIIIVSDTLRRDHLGCYGNDWVSTPHIDAFAAKANDPESNFDWFDAAVLSYQMGRRLEKELDQIAT